MTFLFILLATLLASANGWFQARKLQKIGQEIHSRPIYYAAYCGLWVAILTTLSTSLWLFSEALYIKPIILTAIHNSPIDQAKGIQFIYLQVEQVAFGSALNVPTEIQSLADQYQLLMQQADNFIYIVMFIALALSLKITLPNIRAEFKAREKVEHIVTILLASSSLVAVITTFGIVLSLIFETFRFFQHIPFFDFIFGTHWSPQMAIRADQAGSSGGFGFIPLFSGTLLIAFIAMCIAVPIGLFSAIYLAEFASSRVRNIFKPTLEVLAGIPTVVYGFFAALTVAPAIVEFASFLDLEASSESALAAGLVMGVMIIPFISSLSEDVISAVPQNLRDASLGMGATQAETITKVVLPAALPGIVSSLILAFSRAIGETMIVVMAAGLASNLTANPLESVTTITAQIVTILVGDQSFDSP
ncbi:MAG: phosphate ABC transporter permease subunit PstC, partial [Gammaproteobacteria bacterium]|nr:phosphate ABC transporter permease subunit PstC [Gammaproteobacteria bacterium]